MSCNHYSDSFLFVKNALKKSQKKNDDMAFIKMLTCEIISNCCCKMSLYLLSMQLNKIMPSHHVFSDYTSELHAAIFQACLS